MSKTLFSMIISIFMISTSIAGEINGIGNIKIGMTIEDFLELPEIKSKEVMDTSIYARTPGENYLWKKTSADKSINENLRIYSDDVVSYEFISSIGINNIHGVDKFKIVAEFYKGNLAIISISDKVLDVLEILTSKYGNPNIQDFTKLITCQNGFGAVFKRIDGSKYYEWGKGKAISATLSKSFSDCGKDISTLYMIKNNSIAKSMLDFENKARKASMADKDKSRANSSKL